jgi:sugar-specific transcriptional regulator TrmB
MGIAKDTERKLLGLMEWCKTSEALDEDKNNPLYIQVPPDPGYIAGRSSARELSKEMLNEALESLRSSPTDATAMRILKDLKDEFETLYRTNSKEYSEELDREHDRLRRSGKSVLDILETKRPVGEAGSFPSRSAAVAYGREDIYGSMFHQIEDALHEHKIS